MPVSWQCAEGVVPAEPADPFRGLRGLGVVGGGHYGLIRIRPGL